MLRDPGYFPSLGTGQVKQAVRSWVDRELQEVFRDRSHDYTMFGTGAAMLGKDEQCGETHAGTSCQKAQNLAD